MRQINNLNTNKLGKYFRYGSIFLTLLFVIYSVFFGIEMMDSGFIISLAKKMQYGQIIYKDFDYVRPPITLIFWNIILKPFWYFTNYVFLISRLFVLAQFVFIAYNVLKIITGSKKNSLYAFCFILVLLININPLMPWHTVDGIFFLSFAIRYLRHERFLLSLFFSFLAAGTKQPFLIPFILILIYYIYNWKKLKWQENYWPITLFLFFLLFVIKQYNLAEAFLYYKSSSGSTVHNFFTSGFFHYYEGLSGRMFFGIATSSIIFGVIFGKSTKVLTSLKFYVAFVFLYCILVPLDFFFHNFNETFRPFNFILFDTILMASVLVVIVKRQNSIFKFFVIICVWAASISWGYNSILFGFAFLILIFRKEFHLILKYKFISFFIIGVLLCLRITHTYGEIETLPNRLYLIKNTPVCSGIFTNIKNVKRLEEAELITKKFKNCIFVNSMVMASAIFKEYPHRSVWEYDAETPSYREDLQLIKRNDITYIIDKSRKGNNSFLVSTLQTDVILKKKVIYKTSNFEVYK